MNYIDEKKIIIEKIKILLCMKIEIYFKGMYFSVKGIFWSISI